MENENTQYDLTTVNVGPFNKWFKSIEDLHDNFRERDETWYQRT